MARISEERTEKEDWSVGWLVGRLVARFRTPEDTERLVKMQTSRFGVDAGRERSPVVARSDVVASLAPCSKSWTWIVKTEKKKKDSGRRESEHARKGEKKR